MSSPENGKKINKFSNTMLADHFADFQDWTYCAWLDNWQARAESRFRTPGFSRAERSGVDYWCWVPLHSWIPEQSMISVSFCTATFLTSPTQPLRSFEQQAQRRNPVQYLLQPKDKALRRERSIQIDISIYCGKLKTFWRWWWLMSQR